MGTIFLKKIFNLLKGWKIPYIFSLISEEFLYIPGVDISRISFPGWENIRQNNFVRRTESFGEIRQKCLCPGVSVGLENAPQCFVGIFLGCGQRGVDFCGVVGVIVDYCNAVKGTFIFKTAICPIIVKRPCRISAMGILRRTAAAMAARALVILWSPVTFNWM